MAYRAVYRHNMMERTGFRVEELKFWTFVFQFLALVNAVVWFGQNCVPRPGTQAWGVKDQISILYNTKIWKDFM